MGGYGSGRRWTYSKKVTVEDSRSLNISKLHRDGLLKPGCYNLTWTNTGTGEKTGSISYALQRGQEGDPEGTLYMTLNYQLGKEKIPVAEPIKLEATRPNFGGVRYWFTCPLIVNGRPCNRRAGRLHLISGCQYFGCRNCLNLTYTSRQTHDKRFDHLNRLLKTGRLDLADHFERNLFKRGGK